MGKHVAGGKVTSAHSSIIDAAIEIVKAAQKESSVTKIVLGIIKPNLPSAPKRIKIQSITGGLRVTVRGSCSAQELYIYTNNPDKTTRILEGSFIPK